MNRNTFGRLAVAALLAVAAGAASAQNWKPTRPINLIVPWAAGGSTDQVTRVTAAELEKVLGQTIVIVNQPGASGAIGTKSALDAAKDGYTWTAGAAQDLGTYETLGSLKTRITDWHLFLTVASGRRRLPRIMSACSTASCVVASVSPETVATTAGLPPS